MADSPEVMKRECVFRGKKVVLEVHTVRAADGRTSVREVILHPGSVAILAFPEADRVLMERVWRYAMDREMLEIPAGTVDPGEEPEACAARERAEETGYRAGRLERLVAIHPSPGILSERLEIFQAHDLEPGEPRREAGEQIENVLVPIDEVLEMIRDGRVTDAKTVAALLYWDRFVSENP